MTRNPNGGRRNYLINPAFQLSFVGVMLLLAAVCISVFCASNLYFIWKFLEVGRSLGLPEGHPFFRFIAQQKQILLSVSLVTAVLVGAVIFVGGVLLSHRIAGPIHRMQSHLDRVAETARAEALTFRKGDYFPEMAESINKALQALSDRKRADS